MASLRLLNLEITGLRTAPDSAARWVVTIKNITHKYDGVKLHEILASARCMVWHALVEVISDQLYWTLTVLNEENAIRLLPIDIPEGSRFAWSWAQSWLPEDKEQLDKSSRAAICSGESGYKQQFRSRMKDGTIRWLQEDVQIDPISPGRWRLVGVCTDITDQKRIEEEARTSQQRLARHLQNTPLAVIEWDANLCVRDWNPSAERIFGYTREEALGKPAVELLDTDHTAVGMSAIWQMLLGQRHGDDTVHKHITREGKAVICEWYNTPLVDESNRIIGVASLALDVTHRVHVEEERRSAEAELQKIYANARCMVWHAIVTDLGEEFAWELHISDEEAARRWMPIPSFPGQPYGWAWTMARFKEDLERMDGISREALRGGKPGYVQEFRCPLVNGDVRWVSEDVQIETIGPGRWSCTGVVTDITERKRAQEMLEAERNVLRTLIDNLPVSVYCKDVEGKFVTTNAAHARMLGASGVADVLGHTVYDFFSEDVARTFETDDLDVMKAGLPMIDKIEHYAGSDGSERWLSVTKVPLRDIAGTVYGLVGISLDVTHQKLADAERELMLAEAIERADHDPLTGLLNHRAFHKRLSEEVSLALESNAVFAVAAIDLDNFRFFNDAYGHAVGDSVLCEVATALSGCCRPGDVLARFGGDEFALLMPDTDASHAAELVHKLTGCLEQVGYRPPGYDAQIPLTVSIGLATYPEDGANRMQILAAADDRLLRAKSGGYGGELFDEVLRRRLSDGFEHFSMLNALVSAVDNKDRYTRRHSQDVLDYSLDIARELGFDDTALFYIQVAALLHDVGKIGVPDSILRKPGKLTDEEYNAIKQHPVMGAIMVAAMPGFEPILDAVRHHHERWDGKGYPDSLAGEDIPLTARLMAVADAYSAMTTDRPYRLGMDPEVALDVLRNGAGTHWDPTCVEAFLKTRARRDPR
jgi:diguanylate cyclase (GGDEF)-like protein/PAS domain S-box-containing protein